jgi:hypothetical protein
MYEHFGKKKKNLFPTLWYRGAILLAEMWGVVVRKLADWKVSSSGLVSFKSNTPRI